MQPAALDPIVPLSVAVAETPGSYALLLGAGVSRDARMPTGGEVLRGALSDLARLETSEGVSPPDDLDAWLERTGRREVTYSHVLEALVPHPDDRRAYLASRLNAGQPGETHRRLAALARDGWVRVFVTTNFDRLLETALREAGLEPVVVSSDDDLTRAPAREHTSAFVLKVHGDLLERTVRNTDAELAALEPGVAAQLAEVLDRYGLLVLGHSGSDPAIRDALTRREPRYGLFWQTRTSLTGQTAELVHKAGGRAIVRDSAAALLRDLDRRLTLYRHHPTGDTPEVIGSEIVRLLRAGDEVGVRELAMAEHEALLRRARELVVTFAADRGSAAALGRSLAPALERSLAAHLPLIRHGSVHFVERARALGEIGSTRLAGSTSTAFGRLGQWIAWWLSYACGAYAVACRNWPAVRALFDVTLDAQHFGRRSLAVTFAGETAELIADQLLREETGDGFYDPPFVLVAQELRASAWLAERYPELVSSADTLPGELERPDEHLADFSLLRTFKAGQLGGQRHHASWTVLGTGAERLANALVADARLRAEVAETVFGLALDEFDASVPVWLREALTEGTMPRGHSASDAAEALRKLET